MTDESEPGRDGPTEATDGALEPDGATDSETTPDGADLTVTESVEEPTADGGAGGGVQSPGERDLWTYWVRWPDIDEAKFTEYGSPLPRGDLHIHRVCRLAPSRRAREEGGPENFEFISGTPRWLLRHTPLVVLIVGLIFVVSAELSPEVQGLSAVFSVVSPENTLLILAGVLPLPVLVWLLSSAGVLDARDLSKAVVVYGTGLVLVVGTGFSFLLVALSEDPSTLPDNIVFTSGYLLTLFVGGHLLYEGMLKIEFLFANLGDRDIVKSDPHVYEAFLAELNGALRRDFLRDDLAAVLPGRAGRWVRAVGEATVGVPSSHVFAALVSLQFGVLWWFQGGPQNLGFSVTLVGNVALNVLIVVAAFQFLVVIAYFNRLLENEFVTDDGERVNLTSEPFHYDGRAGFADFGRFAIQINVILIVAALYCVYRLYVQGGRVLGADGMAGLGEVELLLWAFSYLVPVLALALAAGAWIYYSYWAMHEKMERDREHLCMRFQGTAPGTEGEAPAVGDHMDSFERGPDWSYVQQTPTWPVNNQRLVSMVSGTLSPVLLVLPSLL